MARSRHGLVCLLATASIACSPSTEFDPASVEGEAQAFMDAYGEELAAHEVAAIADRYDRRGAYFMGHGSKALSPFEAIRARYRDSWEGPAAFEWHDLSFEVISPDAVVVAGRFSWTLADTLPPLSMSYTGLLLRQDGGLRIRLEDESMDLSQAAMFMTRMDEREELNNEGTVP